MKTKFMALIEETSNPTNFQGEKLLELTAMDYILKCVAEKLKSKISKVEDLIEMHDYWMVRSDNILIPIVMELKNVIEEMKAYRAKSITLKKN